MKLRSRESVFQGFPCFFCKEFRSYYRIVIKPFNLSSRPHQRNDTLAETPMHCCQIEVLLTDSITSLLTKMAASLRGYGFKRNLMKIPTIFTQYVKRISDATVVMSDDSSVVVCWHPENSFPYELSRPITKKELKKPSDSILKVQSSKELLSLLKPKREDLVRQELVAITYTLKHIWVPKKFQFRRKEKLESDRPYL